MDRKNQKIDEIKQRILYFAESQNIRKGYLYEVIELSQSNFSGTGASSSLKSENLIKVLNVFPELNPEWLLLGTGEMLRKSTENTSDRICDDAKENYTGPNQSRYDDEIIRGLISSIQSLTHSIDKLTDKLCNS